jgi:hypothetical protein
MSLQPDDRVLVIPLGVHGSVIRLRDDGRVVVWADCATQPVVWKISEVTKAGAGVMSEDRMPQASDAIEIGEVRLTADDVRSAIGSISRDPYGAAADPGWDGTELLVREDGSPATFEDDLSRCHWVPAPPD